MLVLGLTAVAAIAFARSLHAGTVYDEGVYLASLDALGHGQKLGSEVFASQAPGFYVLLQAEKAIFGGSVVAMRLAMLALALTGGVSAYFVGRCIAGLAGGFLAMALLVIPLGIEDEATRIRADFPAVALSLTALALALFAARRNGAAALVAATLAGGVLAAAVSVKLLAATTVVPVLWIVLRGPARRLALPLGAGAAAVALALVGFYATVLGPLWNDVVRFHLEAQSLPIPGAPRDLAGNFAKLGTTLTDGYGLRSPFLWLVLVGVLGTLLAWRRRRLLDALPLWSWPLLAGAFLIWHRPLWAHDVTILTASLAVASGAGLAALVVESRPAARVFAGTCLIVIAAIVAHDNQGTPQGESAGIRWAATVLRSRTPEGSTVASDLPIIPYLADRRQPGALVDTSSTRVASGWLTRGEILRSIDRSRVRAVVVGHNFALDPRLVQEIRRRFPAVVRRDRVRILGGEPTTVRIYLPA